MTKVTWLSDLTVRWRGPITGQTYAVSPERRSVYVDKRELEWILGLTDASGEPFFSLPEQVGTRES